MHTKPLSSLDIGVLLCPIALAIALVISGGCSATVEEVSASGLYRLDAWTLSEGKDACSSEGLVVDQLVEEESLFEVVQDVDIAFIEPCSSRIDCSSGASFPVAEDVDLADILFQRYQGVWQFREYRYFRFVPSEAVDEPDRCVYSVSAARLDSGEDLTITVDRYTVQADVVSGENPDETRCLEDDEVAQKFASLGWSELPIQHDCYARHELRASRQK